MNAPEALSREELLVLLQDLLRINREQQERIAWLEAEIARLGGGSPPSARTAEPPPFVKPNRPPREKQPRRKRLHGYARRREEPTRVVEHVPGRCSRCGRELADGWVHDRRQVIEIPVAPIEVIEHRFVAQHCGVCRRREMARPDLSAEVVGKSRLGVRLMSLIGYLDVVCRMPLRTIQSLLRELYGLRVSQGEIVRVLHTLSHQGRKAHGELLAEARGSGVLQADETGAREDGVNGYLWSLSTENVRYYHRDPSRGAQVIQQLLGYDPQVYQARSAQAVREARKAQREADGAQRPKPFGGTLVSDFYTAYSWYGGEKQRCLVHLDRDLDDLLAKHPDDPHVAVWVGNVLDVMERAKEYAKRQRGDSPDPWRLRRKRRKEFEQEAENLARPYTHSALPQRTLAERIIKHKHQLFVFVEQPDVPPDNNAAERAIRPFVVLRKVSGGTRSPAGSRTQAVLLSLFGTWLLRGQDALAACQQMLAGAAVPAPT